MKRTLTLLAALLLAASAHAADPPLRASLLTVLEDGTARWNAGDHDGCRAAFVIGLLAARDDKELANREDLRKTIDDALKDGDAWSMRTALDQLRYSLKPVAVKIDLKDQPCSCGDKSTCTCDQCAARKAAKAGVKDDRSASVSSTVPAPPPSIHLPAATVVSTSVCQCQQGGGCRCMAQTGTCHCAMNGPHVFRDTVNRYFWQRASDGSASYAALIDKTTLQQAGAWDFEAKRFSPMEDGKWGAVCDPPIPPPGQPQSQPAAVMSLRTAPMAQPMPVQMMQSGGT